MTDRYKYSVFLGHCILTGIKALRSGKSKLWNFNHQFTDWGEFLHHSPEKSHLCFYRPPHFLSVLASGSPPTFLGCSLGKLFFPSWTHSPTLNRQMFKCPGVQILVCSSYTLGTLVRGNACFWRSLEVFSSSISAVFSSLLPPQSYAPDCPHPHSCLPALLSLFPVPFQACTFSCFFTG